MRSKLAAIGLAVLAALTIACGVEPGDSGRSVPDDQETDQPVVVTTPLAPTTAAEPTPPVPTTPTLLVVPDGLVGQNAQIARERLEDMGFTNVLYASADPDDTVVVWAPNWHVVGVEPAPGTELSPDSTIILTCSKQ